MRQRAIQINFVTSEEVRDMLKARGAEFGLTASGMAALVVGDWFDRGGPAPARKPPARRPLGASAAGTGNGTHAMDGDHSAVAVQ